MSDFTALKQAACMDELQKIAGEFSEATMTGLGVGSGLAYAIHSRSPGAAAATLLAGGVPMGIGYLTGPKTKEEMIKQEGRGASNVLLPFAAQYRMGRRLATPKKIREEAKVEFKKMKARGVI